MTETLTREDIASFQIHDGCNKDWQFHALCDLALSALSAAEAAADAQKRIDELEEALRPFAKYAEYLDHEWADHGDEIIVAGPLESNMTFGDFRKAARALNTPKEAGDGIY